MKTPQSDSTVFSFDEQANRIGPTEQSVSFDDSSTPTNMKSGDRAFASSLATPSSKSTASILIDTETIAEDDDGEDNQRRELAVSSPNQDQRVRAKNRYREKFMAKFLYLFLVSMVVLMLNADQNLLAPSLTEIAKEFNFTDEEKDLYLGGYLSIAFFACGGVAALVAGYVADTYDRRISFTIVVLTGGSYPILFSMIGDTFIDEWRGRASSFLQIVSGGGVLFGQTIAALIAPTFGWRVPFAVVSVPAIAMTIIFFCTATEPKRGTKERVLQQMVKERKLDATTLDSYKETMTKEKFFLLLRSRTVVLLLLVAIPSNLPWGFLLVYAQDFLMQDVGKTVPGGISASESLLVVIIFAISSALGGILGGMVTDYLWKRRPVLVSWFAAVTTIVGAIPMFFVANSRMPYFAYCLLVAPSGFIVSIGGIAKNAMLLNCTLPETRGTAFALNTLTDDLSKGLGSFLIAMMIVGLGGRVPAFNVAFGGWIFAGGMFAVTACTLTRDLGERNERLMRSVRPSEPEQPSVHTRSRSNVAEENNDQVAAV